MAELHVPHPAPVTLDVFPEPVLPALFAVAIGPIGASRYPQLFVRFEAGGRAPLCWNWAACFCTFNWMIFRRLWQPASLYAAAVLLLPLLLLAVGRLLLQWSEAVEAGVLLGFAALAFALPALLGDRLLYHCCRANITRALERAPTMATARAALAQSAPSRTGLQRQLVVNALLLTLLAVLGFLAWPSARVADNTEAPFITIQPIASAPASAPAFEPASAPASEPASAGMLEPTAASNPTPALSTNAPIPAQSASGYHVNVGLFADPDNARRAYVKLVKAGLPAHRDMLMLKGQKVTRVRAGPFGSIGEANAAIAQIKIMQLDAVLAKP